MSEVWDWDESTRPVAQTFLPHRADLGEITPSRSHVTQITRDEATPLLTAPPTSAQVGNYGGPDAYISESHISTDRSLLRRKSSTTLKKQFNYGGKSTYGQTVGNVT